MNCAKNNHYSSIIYYSLKIKIIKIENYASWQTFGYITLRKSLVNCLHA